MQRLKTWLVALILFGILGAPSALAVRVNITPVAGKSVNNGAISANGADVALTAADATNKQEATITGRELILAYNSDSGAHTVTFTSIADDLGRTGDITSYSVGAGEFALFGPFTLKGWQQSNGKVYFEANDATVKFLVIRY